MQAQGIIRGKQITLSHTTGLPDGVFVTLDIRWKPLSLEKKRAMVDRLCGSWAQDPSIPDIFHDIETQRHASKPREVIFDAAS